MSKKKVLIIEDRPLQRERLQKELEDSGFEVYAAANEIEGRQEADQHWEDLDVVILDNDLGRNVSTTGSDIAIEYREKKKSFPPESIIYSKFDDVEFYQKALRLGAAAYLSKNDQNANIVDHVKVLALCRALNPANPKLVREMARTVAYRKSESAAILAFCRGVLKSEVESCLRVPYIVLLTQDGKTLNCASTPGLPSESPVYQEIQDVAHANLSGPSTLDVNKLDRPTDQATRELHKILNGSELLPLSNSENLKLSICILANDPTQQSKQHTDAKSLCKVLSQYFRPTVFANIVNIWSQWAELHATRISTAKLCLAVGQEINYGLGDSKQLQDLANDLSDTGQYLTQLDKDISDKLENLSVKGLVTSAWNGVAHSTDGLRINPPEVTCDCELFAKKSDLDLIFSRLLQWFVYRTRTMPLDVEPAIKIDCETSETGATVIFEDNSHRLPKRLREDLFAPFTQAIPTPFARIDEINEEDGAKKVKKGKGRNSQNSYLNTGRYLPLYLAKVLVEGRYRGVLEDQSDEITEYNYGHRILMQFPSSNKPELN